MMERIEEIQQNAEKLELMLKALVEDRSRAWSEVARLRKELDEREMAYLQLDEEHNASLKRFEEERAKMDADREEAERQIGAIAGRIHDLLPLLELRDAQVQSDVQ